MIVRRWEEDRRREGEPSGRARWESQHEDAIRPSLSLSLPYPGPLLLLVFPLSLALMECAFAASGQFVGQRQDRCPRNTLEGIRYQSGTQEILIVPHSASMKNILSSALKRCFVNNFLLLIKKIENCNRSSPDSGCLAMLLLAIIACD